MKKYELRTEYECLVKHSQGESFLDLNSSLIFDAPEKIVVYPLNQSKSCFPFTISLEDNNKNRFYKTFSYDDTCYIYISNFPFVKNQIIEEITVNNKTFRIFLSENSVCFESTCSRKTLDLNSSFDSYLIQTEKHFILLHLIGKLEEMWIYNTKNNQISHLYGKKIEKIEQQILVSKEINDIANHELFETYQLSDEDCTKKHCKIKYFDTYPQKITNDLIVPLAFLEAVKIEDFDLAKEYLSETIKEETSVQHFKKYFGRILSIIPLKDYTIAVINEEKTVILKFLIKNSLILDISIEN